VPQDLSLLGHDAVLLGEKRLHCKSSGPFFLHDATPKMWPLQFFEHRDTYPMTQHHVPEDSNLRQNCCRNLRSPRQRLLTKRHSRSPYTPGTEFLYNRYLFGVPCIYATPWCVLTAPYYVALATRASGLRNRHELRDVTGVFQILLDHGLVLCLGGITA